MPSLEPNRSRRNAASHTAILDAAVELVAEVGYARLSIEAIAARAGVGKQTIYRWWSSKGSVLLDAFLRKHTVEGHEDSPGLPDTGDLTADLRTVMRATIEELHDPTFEKPLRALTVAVLTDDALAKEYLKRFEAPTRELKKQRLRSAQEAGQLPDDLDLDAALDAIFSPLTQRWLFRTGPLTPDYADRTVEIALDGMRRTGSVISR
ncbi:TetR/AcrR family transcriptional regulator [Rhodococcus sp. SJ-3]|uniref:TetR/AcrR family transcriptional regulator n=1 Tax=Rhodococcus sp. SJ-3 TaxID=3454628 RepID=UPI003F7A3942